MKWQEKGVKERLCPKWKKIQTAICSLNGIYSIIKCATYIENQLCIKASFKRELLWKTIIKGN